MKKKYFLTVVALQLALLGFSQQDTLHHYTDAEVMKLSGYIKNLEQKTTAYMAAHPSDAFVNIVANSTQEKMIITAIVNDSLHRYNDAQVIKLARYIKHLEKLDSLNTAEIIATNAAAAAAAAAKKRQEDSLALASTQVKGLEQFQNQINFDFNSASIKNESYNALNEAVKLLKESKDAHFVIEGHTDNVGTDEYNLSLSKARANAVRQYFIAKGIPASRISAVGHGEAKPIATNDTEEGRAKNRRVEIRSKKK